MLAFFTFGGALLAPRLGEITGSVILYGVLSLTVVRMIPVGISMIRSGMDIRSTLFMGWFGPRGLASLVFAATIVIESGLPNAELINLVVLATVGLSIIAHGITAWPGSNAYGKWFEQETDKNLDPVEATEVDRTAKRALTRREWSTD